MYSCFYTEISVSVPFLDKSLVLEVQNSGGQERERKSERGSGGRQKGKCKERTPLFQPCMLR